LQVKSLAKADTWDLSFNTKLYHESSYFKCSNICHWQPPYPIECRSLFKSKTDIKSVPLYNGLQNDMEQMVFLHDLCK